MVVLAGAVVVVLAVAGQGAVWWCSRCGGCCCDCVAIQSGCWSGCWVAVAGVAQAAVVLFGSQGARAVASARFCSRGADQGAVLGLGAVWFPQGVVFVGAACLATGPS